MSTPPDSAAQPDAPPPDAPSPDAPPPATTTPGATSGGGHALDPGFGLVAERAPIGIVHTDVGGRIVFANARWRELTGYEGELPVALSALWPVVHPDDAERIGITYTAAVRDRTEWEQECRFVGPTGVRHVIMSAAPLADPGSERDPDGNAGHGAHAGFVGTIVDVTAMREAEQRNREEHERYRNLIERSAVGQAVYDLRGRMVEVNPAWAGLLGYDPSEVIGTRASDHVHEEDRGEMMTRVDALLDGTLPFYETERRLVRKDGTPVWVSSTITVERTASGEPTHFHSLVLDIDERKRAELAWREAELRYRAVIESMHDGLIIHDLHGIVAANEGARRILGVPEGEEIDAHALAAIDVLDNDGRPHEFRHRPSVRAFVEGKPVHGVVQGIAAFDGELRWCLTNAVPLFHDDSDATPYAVALMFADITERKNVEDELRKSEERFRTLTESIPVGIYRADISGNVDYVNPRWYEISDASPRDLDEIRSMTRVHPDDRKRVQAEMYATLAERRTFQGQYRLIRSNGDLAWVNSRAAAVLDPDTGEITGYVGSLEDITPLITAQDETHRLADIIESTSDLVGIADQRLDKLAYLNRSAREKFGLVDVDITEMDDLDLFTEESIATYVTEIEEALHAGRHWSGELTMQSQSGEIFHVWQTMSAEFDGDGNIVLISSVGRDVTEQRRQQEELAFRATHDDLTGLPNRTLLLQHLDDALAEAGNRSAQVALLFVDLDRFKQVNDTLGHTAGDTLLVEAASRITSVLRSTDVVARLGGDEFVILCRRVPDEHHAVATAHRISSVLEQEPFLLDGAEVAITASIGIALSTAGGPTEAAHAEAILRDADAAMYRAKDLGRARLEVFDEQMRRRTAHRLELTDQLTVGIETGAIVVYYQPCVDLQTGRVTSVEALARWQHPDRGILGPVEFIELAEETGLIVGLGLTVLSKACLQGRQWELQLGGAMPRVHVNLSARQLTSTNLPDLVRGVLADTGLTPHRLCLEITESVLMDDAEAVLDTLARLKEIGVALAIDDFGTGYSSLSYLRRFPVDILKVDHSFVDGLGPDPEDSAIVEAIVGLARTLDLEAIAEGVEHEDQVQRLRKLGCGGAQGFYFARPAPAPEITAALVDGFVV